MCVCILCRLVETGSSSVQSLSLSESHLAELDGETLRLFGLGALEALERGWGVQTAGAVTVITFRYISFDAIVPTLPRIRVKFPNLSVRPYTIMRHGVILTQIAQENSGMTLLCLPVVVVVVNAECHVAPNGHEMTQRVRIFRGVDSWIPALSRPNSLCHELLLVSTLSFSILWN